MQDHTVEWAILSLFKRGLMRTNKIFERFDIYMLMSKLIGQRFKEAPTEANIISHNFLLRGAYIRQVAGGIYSLLTPAKKIAQNIENILRIEMRELDGQEVKFPLVTPRELFEESNRYEVDALEIVTFRDRNKRNFSLGTSHEEAAIHLARTEATTYTDYPFSLYQIQTKFRDEPHTRGALVRLREFTTKDAYSFHATEESLEEYYNLCRLTYKNIFRHIGLPTVYVEAENGQEFMSLCEAGESEVATCKCGYCANIHVAKGTIRKPEHQEQKSLSKTYTPDLRTIDDLANFLKIESNRCLKATVFEKEGSSKPVIVFIRGDLEVNEDKLRVLCEGNIYPLVSYGENDSLTFGFIGPIGLDDSKYDIFYDFSLEGINNLVCGANEEDYHTEGVCLSRDLPNITYVDLATVTDDFVCSKCNENNLILTKGIKVGTISKLGTKHTSAMNMLYIDSEGNRQNPFMGYYAIGIERVIAALIESNHDDNGPIWPQEIAPWQIHICAINLKDDAIKETANSLYSQLRSAGYEVLMDDRQVSAGNQFADADLLGIPVRITVSPRNLKSGCYEVSTRDKRLSEMIGKDDIENALKRIIVA